ncbi:MAG: exodeoxyribonuclease VII large subunit [Chloroflexi bacterium]|nr:exodeoxyribonuclease VII large subunit [Chloroflexota bacterium]
MTTPTSARRRSIGQVNRMIRSIVEAETLEQFFWVGGRIDRYFKSDLGHVYFDLVDDKTRIRCMMRAEQAGRLPLELRNHLDVEVFGDIHFYEDRAEAQMNVTDLRLSDDSVDATPAVDRLRAQGLYPPEKRTPPSRIRRIGIITSRGSRAIGDFEDAYQSAGERRVLAPVEWKYVILEGDRAIQSIVDAIHAFDKSSAINLIAIIRGGGRSENLAVFDSFEIAEAVIQSKTYFVTGIGHHRDSTLADDVADYATSTPTAVAHYLAELCLRESPANATNTPHRIEHRAASVSAQRDFGRRGAPSQKVEPVSRGPEPPTAGSSRATSVLIVVLLILAVASVAYFIAVLIAQVQ